MPERNEVVQRVPDGSDPPRNPFLTMKLLRFMVSFAALFSLTAHQVRAEGPSPGDSSVRFEAQENAGDTAMFRGGPTRTGEEPGPGPEGSPVLIWSYVTADEVVSSPVVS